MNTVQERGIWKPVWKITKYASQSDKQNNNILEEVVIDGNLLTKAGINEIWTLVSGSGGEQFGELSNLIVGTGSGAATDEDAEVTFTNGVKEAMESGYPTYGTSQKVTFKASYDGDTANQAWNEFGVLSKESSGILLNRKVSSQGTKTLGQVWELELEISLA